MPLVGNRGDGAFECLPCAFFFIFRQGDGSVRQTRLLAIAIVAVLSGCGTSPPKDFGGRWKPVNRFAEAPTEIPLYSSYVFQASPTDGTLKQMLTRWAKDTGLSLDYRVSSDYTLYGKVASLNTTDAQQAASEVTAAYASQGVQVSVQGNSLIVTPAVVATPQKPGSRRGS